MLYQTGLLGAWEHLKLVSPKKSSNTQSSLRFQDGAETEVALETRTLRTVLRKEAKLF